MDLTEVDERLVRQAIELARQAREAGNHPFGALLALDGTVLLTTDPMPPPAQCDRGFASACFRDTPLAADDENLILWRWDARIVLKPVQPRPR